MKRFLFIAVTLILSVMQVTYAQEAIEGAGDTPVYENIFTSIAGLAAGVVFLIEGLKRLFPSMSGLVTQVTSWSLGVVVAMAGWVFHFGIFDGITWYMALFYGIAASLIANGIADTGFIGWLVGLFKPKTGIN